MLTNVAPAGVGTSAVNSLELDEDELAIVVDEASLLDVSTSVLISVFVSSDLSSLLQPANEIVAAAATATETATNFMVLDIVGLSSLTLRPAVQQAR